MPVPARNSTRRRSPRSSAFTLSITALTLTAVAGCSRCGGGVATKETVQVAHSIPAQVQAAVIVPDLAALGERLRLLESLKLASFAAQLQGLPNAQAFGDAIARQAGVDVRSAESLKNAGIAPDRGFGVALLSDDAGYFVVGVKDEAAFAATMKRLAGDRLGAREEGSGKTAQGGHKHVWFTRSNSPQHQLGYVLRDGLAFVSTGAMSEKLPEWAALPREKSLGEDARFKASLERLPKERDLVAHVPLGKWTAQGGPGLTAVARLDATGLFIDADAPWPDTRESLSALEPRDAPDQTALLPQDAFAVFRYRGEAKGLSTVLPMIVGPHLRRAFEGAGLKLEEALLQNLKPGAVASLSVSPDIQLSGGMPELDVRRTNPFRYAQLVAYAQPQKPEDATALLGKMPEVAPRFGARIEGVEREGRTLYLTRYAQGEGVHMAQAADGRVVFASPLGRLEQTLKALPETPDPARAGPPLLRDESLKEALNAHAFSMVVDLNQLRDSVRALPADAWGIGGFAMKASALRWLDATDDLRAITMGASRASSGARTGETQVAGNGDSVRLQLNLRFAKK